MSMAHENMCVQLYSAQCTVHFCSNEVNQCNAKDQKRKSEHCVQDEKKCYFSWLFACETETERASSQPVQMIRLRISKSLHDRNISCSVPMRWRINYRCAHSNEKERRTESEKARWTTNSAKKGIASSNKNARENNNIHTHTQNIKIRRKIKKHHRNGNMKRWAKLQRDQIINGKEKHCVCFLKSSFLLLSAFCFNLSISPVRSLVRSFYRLLTQYTPLQSRMQSSGLRFKSLYLPV